MADYPIWTDFAILNLANLSLFRNFLTIIFQAQIVPRITRNTYNWACTDFAVIRAVKSLYWGWFQRIYSGGKDTVSVPRGVSLYTYLAESWIVAFYTFIRAN